MRAAIYLRVSTDHAEQKLSPEHQLATCMDYAKEIGLQTDNDLVYNDAGLSGTEMESRAEVLRLVTDARKGKFGAIVFTAISRFARDLADALALKKRLESIYGIRIISVEEGYDTAMEGRNSEMIFTVHAMVAAHKSQEMSKAIRRGLRQSAVSGRHIGNAPPYGYQKTLDKKLIPDPLSAPIIKEIFDLYLTGFGCKAIAEKLNHKCVPTASTASGKAKKFWQASTVSAILHNVVYAGDLVANKWRIDTDIERSRELDVRIKRQMQRDENEWIVIQGNHEPLIDRDTFHAAQKLMKQKATIKGVKRTTNFLTGMMKCLECGGAMIVSTSKVRNISYKYVVCAATRRIGKYACTNHVRHRYEDVLSAVLRPLQCNSAVQKKMELFISRINQALVDNGVPERILEIHKQLEHNRRRQQEAVRAFTDGLFSMDVIREHQGELIDEAKHLQDELKGLEEQWASLGTFEDKQAEICELLNFFAHVDQFDPVTVRTALAVMVNRIEFTGDKRIKIVYQWTYDDCARQNTFLMRYSQSI